MQEWRICALPRGGACHRVQVDQRRRHSRYILPNPFLSSPLVEKPRGLLTLHRASPPRKTWRHGQMLGEASDGPMQERRVAGGKRKSATGNGSSRPSGIRFTVSGGWLWCLVLGSVSFLLGGVDGRYENNLSTYDNIPPEVSCLNYIYSTTSQQKRSVNSNVKPTNHVAYQFKKYFRWRQHLSARPSNCSDRE